jgi:hypothetical protein
MGTRADSNGISLQLVDADNKAIEAPVFGAHAHLHGIARSEALKHTTLAEGESEGSEHWMTLLVVADTEERLHEIVSTSKAAQGSCETSCASHRVLVEIHVGNRRETLEGRTVIASGPILKFDPPEVNVVHVKVLPKDVVVTQRHPLVKEFEAQAPRFAKEFEGMTPLSARGIIAAADSLVKKAEAEAAAAVDAAVLAGVGEGSAAGAAANAADAAKAAKAAKAAGSPPK